MGAFSNMYDDSPLRKKITCLTSGQLLCFVIAAAGLGVAIISLIKLNDLGATTPDGSKISELEYELETLKLKLSNDMATLQGTMNKLVKEGSHPKMDETDSGDSIIKDVPGEKREHTTSYSTSFDHHADVTEDPHSHHRNHDDHDADESHSTHNTERGHVHIPIEDSKDDDTSHEDNTDGSGSGSSDVICDDSDLCPKRDESDDSEEFSFGGSGDCPKFSRPLCPEGASLCLEGSACPVPVCCFAGDDLEKFGDMK